MPAAVADLLPGLTVTAPQHAAGLTVFGLSGPADDPLDYATLDDALAAGSLEVTELSEGGTVPTLKLVNRGGRVFLMAGEQLVGAKQNRVLNTSLFVDAGAELPVPVSCVEQGRWAYRSRQFGSTATASHGKLRAIMAKQVSASYAAFARPESVQGEVWREVSRKLTAVGSSSDTVALEQAYDDRRDRLNDALTQLTPPAGCRGVVFAVHGRVVGADLFDRPATLAKLWPKLVRAYALDALEQPDNAAPPPTAEAVQDWLRRACDAALRSYPSPGVGEDVRLTGPGVVGAGLVVDGRPVHVQLFAEA
ncbi:MAG TPA: DUF6569 family protein [Gemmataceae bacterium]